jgi:hypothetical protein
MNPKDSNIIQELIKFTHEAEEKFRNLLVNDQSKPEEQPPISARTSILQTPRHKWRED